MTMDLRLLEHPLGLVIGTADPTSLAHSLLPQLGWSLAAMVAIAVAARLFIRTLQPTEGDHR